MLVLGISGMDRAIGHKQGLLPGLDRRPGRFVQGLDSAAALVDESGVLAASAQERHSGEKGTGAFPLEAIGACLRTAGVKLDDVDVIAHGFRYRHSPATDLDAFSRSWYEQVYSRAATLAVLADQLPRLERTELSQSPLERTQLDRLLVRVPHHLAHAASTFYPSGFTDATVLVADGMGEVESISLLSGSAANHAPGEAGNGSESGVGGGRLRIERTYPIMSSLGLLYSLITHYLGFLAGMDEYKIMGLAPYGDPGRYADRTDDLLRLGPRGALVIPLLSFDRTPVQRETHDGVMRRLSDVFGPPRDPAAPVEQHHIDLAATLQHCLEEGLLHVLRSAVETGVASPRLCLAGGVALNCTANGVIARSGLFEDMFVQPAAGDDGTAVGAALWALGQGGARVPTGMSMPYWGEEFGPDQIAAAAAGLDAGQHLVRELPERELLDSVATLVAGGQVIAWYQGRMEFGPRALGNRSILADPTAPGMRAHLNAVVKQREEFRPFAPAVTAEAAGEYFEIEPGQERLYRHMLFVTGVRPGHRERLPAVTHVDGSARVQVVDRADAPRFWALLTRFGALTGTPMLLNTSFNLRGQPIVRTPQEAVATYARSTLDALAIGGLLITRRDVRPGGAGDE